jgi:hypothetical protein
MGSVPPLLSFLLVIVSGWVHRHQLLVIEFLQAENRLLKDRLRGKRIRFTDTERALLARKAKAAGRQALLELETIVSPDTKSAAAPQRIGAGDLTDELAYLLADQRSAGLPSSAHARPVIAKAFALPSDHGRGLNEDQSLSPGGPVARQPRPEDAVCRTKKRPSHGSLVDRQLMSQSDDFDLQ